MLPNAPVCQFINDVATSRPSRTIQTKRQRNRSWRCGMKGPNVTFFSPWTWPASRAAATRGPTCSTRTRCGSVTRPSSMSRDSALRFGIGSTRHRPFVAVSRMRANDVEPERAQLVTKNTRGTLPHASLSKLVDVLKNRRLGVPPDQPAAQIRDSLKASAADDRQLLRAAKDVDDGEVSVRAV